MSHRDAYDSETFDLPGGYQVELEILLDDCSEAPWDWSDGHGPVSEWTTRSKAPGEWVLCEDRRSKRYYDAAAAQKQAVEDGWDSPPYGEGTKRARAARAVLVDFKYLKGWCAGDWCFVTLHVTVSRNEEEIADEYLGGVESFGSFWKEEGRSMAEYEVKQDMFARHLAWREALKECRERHYWEHREVVTA